jgi:hypothetical protein
MRSADFFQRASDLARHRRQQVNPIAEPVCVLRSIRHYRQIVQDGIDRFDQPDVLVP